jgi:cystathionine beta-lyase
VVHYEEPQASYLAWLDFRDLIREGDPSALILRNARVALNPGPTFGREGAGFARLNFACSREVLGEAVDRIAHATARLSASAAAADQRR